jgi:5-formyltetrahydrofolate cyclo-ligase
MNTTEQTSQQKNALRRELQRRRQSISTTQKDLKAEHIARSALTLTNHAKRIGIYHALPNEAPTQALAQALWNNGCEVYLPRITDDRILRFNVWERDSVLETGKLNIPTPLSTATEIGAEDLDLVFIPLVGFDRSGHRLGMGGGYYDTTLSTAPRAIKVGLAFDCQEVANLPVEEHDIRLDMLVTESRILRFNNLYSE